MEIQATKFRDIKVIDNFYSYDIRGNFIKLFHQSSYQDMGFNTELKEIYYSTSQKDVIRGMHFQLPPYDHDKIIHVISGGVIDVVIDLRKNSPDYKQCLEIHLSGNKPRSIYIPRGFAHGFKCLENNTVMLYQVTSEYREQCDTGIAYNSIGYDWKVEDPIVSERDKNFVSLNEFVSPF